MFVALADKLDRFLFGETLEVTTEHTEPVPFKIFKPGDPLGVVVNDYSPAD